jgi:deoxyribodipyrimidine photolyase-related protein|uniref:cryptochrome/photolyase family protein n=1 Tax=Cyanobium sp. TaxID=2164130 RepID=UPI00404A1863
MALTLILGNQLYRQWIGGPELQLGPHDTVVMVEDLGVASTYRYHKLRLLHTFVAMRSFRDALVERGIRVRYFELPESEELSFFERLGSELGVQQSSELRVAEIADPGFQHKLEAYCHSSGVQLTVLPSPDFLESAAQSRSWFEGKRRPFMKTFYERQRKRLGLLLEADGSPTGGHWSFDADNRKRLPKGYTEPALPVVRPSHHDAAVRHLVGRYFPDNPGELGPLFIPYDHSGADTWLKCFLQERFADFGPYEDALSGHFDSLNHSLLSPLLNIGLLDPAAVVKAAIDQAAIDQSAVDQSAVDHGGDLFHTPKSIPLASLEGFVRQVIGWREFVRGIHLCHGERQAQANFWDHHRGLAACWQDGTTGLPPLDQAIQRANRLGYNHHIERLMVISNLMLLCEIQPLDVYQWFMERYLDSYDWVMGPNVFGMGQMSDGGIFATKPYICGSNYILKMGDFRRGAWCEIWDGLYWRFIDRHRQFFQTNPRLAMMVRLLDRMEATKRERLFNQAEQFITTTTISPKSDWPQPIALTE